MAILYHTGASEIKCVCFEIEGYYTSKTEEQPAMEISVGLKFKGFPKKIDVT